MAPLVASIDRFMKLVDIQGDHWIWLGDTYPSGYARFWDNKTKMQVYAHRWSYEYFIGYVPDGYDVHHTCSIRYCVSPFCLNITHHKDHCFLSPNTWPSRNVSTIYCPQGHPYDEVNTYIWTNGSRACNTCRRKRALLYYHKTKVSL